MRSKGLGVSRSRRIQILEWKVQKMKMIFVALLGIFLLHSSVQAADKIRISTPADAAHFTMHLAQKRGFLKEEGFDAELVIISGPVANVALSNGDTDYFSGFGSVLRAILQGLPLRIVACYRPTPHFMLQTRPEFKTVKDLKARPSGFAHSAAVPIWSGGLIVKHFGLDPDKDVKWAVAGSDEGRYIRMQQGLLDATMATVPTDYLGRKMGFPVIVRSEDLFTYPFSGLTASIKKIKEKPDEVKRVIARGYQGQPLHARESRWDHPGTDEHLSAGQRGRQRRLRFVYQGF